MDENSNTPHGRSPMVQIFMGLEEATIMGTALGLFISTSVIETDGNECKSLEDENEMFDTLSSKMVAVEMFTSLSRLLSVPDKEIELMLDRMDNGKFMVEDEEDE